MKLSVVRPVINKNILKVKNPFGEDWIDKLKHLLPTIKLLNITDDKILIDGNRKALFIIGHKTKNSKGYVGVTKISMDGGELQIQTTILTPYLFSGIILPLAIPCITWLTIKSTISNIIITLILIPRAISCLSDLASQTRYNQLVKNELEMIL